MATIVKDKSLNFVFFSLSDQKQALGASSKAALENGMQRQIARQEEKKERERQQIAAEKAAAKAAKKPKKQQVEPPE